MTASSNVERGWVDSYTTTTETQRELVTISRHSAGGLWLVRSMPKQTPLLMVSTRKSVTRDRRSLLRGSQFPMRKHEGSDQISLSDWFLTIRGHRPPLAMTVAARSVYLRELPTL
jgi:hypothetical protein